MAPRSHEDDPPKQQQPADTLKVKQDTSRVERLPDTIYLQQRMVMDRIDSLIILKKQKKK